ncbi:MAG: DUF2169 domain-containing protein [Polyangiaceae bacterium]
MSAVSTVPIASVGPCTAATVLWRMSGVLHLTTIVKASFALVPDGPMSLLDAADDIVRADVHHGNNPTRSVKLTTDLAPNLPRADIVLTGHACAPPANPVPALTVRLVVFRDAPLVDKAFRVRGDASGADVKPFDRIPMVYERAYGGIGWPDNPYGRGAVASDPVPPNLFDPRSPQKTVCFAPIPRGFPSRARLLGGIDRKEIEKPVPEIPPELDWTYFQSAPEDQRTDYLHGNEWVILERMTADPTFVRSHLPSALGVVRVKGLTGVPEDQVFPLVADTLRIDADELCCSLVWRSSFVVENEAELSDVRVQGAVQIGPTPIAWPPLTDAAAPAPVVEPPGERRFTAGTMVLEPDAELPPPAVRPGAFPRAVPAAPPPPEETNDRPKFTGTVVMEPDHGGRAAAGPAVPFQPGPVKLPPPKAAPPRDPDEFGSSTLQAPVRALRPPPSMPFPRRPTIPPNDDIAPPPVVAPPTPIAVPPTPVAEAPPPPRPKTPRPEGIHFVNSTGLAFGAVPWALTPSRDCFTVFVKATADIVPGGPAKLRREAAPATGERFEDRPNGQRLLVHPSDVSLYKVRADVVAFANARASEGAAQTVDVRFAFGSGGNAFDRKLTVFGDRRWVSEGGAPKATPPEPFVVIPIAWERAFGGPGFADNPVGVGLFDPLRRKLGPLPNLEDPSRRIRIPKQVVAPVAFAPIPLGWKRPPVRKPGQRFPLFPEDLDWTRFQIAPAEQQLALLRGDEPFVFEGLHAQHPSLGGQLPGIRPRVFADRESDFREVPVHLDTVVFRVDELRVDLVFRGVLSVPDERSPGSIALHLLTEPLTAPPLTLDEARTKVRRT